MGIVNTFMHFSLLLEVALNNPEMPKLHFSLVKENGMGSSKENSSWTYMMSRNYGRYVSFNPSTV